jgi:hypothetical protein
MRGNRQLLLVAILVFLPVVAFPWASVAPLAETHQYIVATALGRLRADPAFETNLFPSFQGVESNEGVELTANGLDGAGADAHGRSTYSEHYYNPVTGEGNAPNSVAHYFSELIRVNVLNLKNTNEGGPKQAAYCAHFLADIFVPYHVNGMSRSTAEKIWVNQRVYETEFVTLPESVTGSMVLAYMTPYQKKGADRNFYPELNRFITLTDPPEFDWFDPWYYNGTSETVSEIYHSQSLDNPALITNASSHILWEGRPTGQLTASAFHQQAGQGMDGYDPHWKNATPVFDNPWVGQAEQARLFTIFKATETRDRQEVYFNTPVLPLRDAIRAVYTLWRASISGLRPTIEYQPEAGSTAYRVTGKVTNAASAEARNLRVRLTTTDCTLPGNDKEKELGNSLAKGSGLEVSWRVQPKVDTLCKLRLEIVGAYAIPDLQYAKVERTFMPEHREEKTTPAPPTPPTTTTPNSQSCVDETTSPKLQPGPDQRIIPGPGSPFGPVTCKPNPGPAGPTGLGGHWERGKALIEWTYRPPTDDKTGRKLGASPSAGDTWVEGGDWAHQVSYTLASIGENQYTSRYVFIPDPKQVNYEMSGAWTLPPTTLTPGQKFIMQVASGNATPLGSGGASCYAWQGEETNNEHLINTDGPNQTLTAQPFTIPKGSPNAQFGFFCGGSVKWVYTYHWVGGGAQ